MGGMGGGMTGFFGGPGPAGGDNPAPGISQPASAVANYEIPHTDVRRVSPVETRTWDPAAPYLKKLHAAPRKEAFSVYMKDRVQHANSPTFFVDCADYFFNIHEPDLAIQVLSNLAEIAPDDAATLRILGHRLAIAGAFDLAVLTLEQVRRLRPDDPQSYRDLALVLAQRADADAKCQTWMSSCRSSGLVVSLDRGPRPSIHDDYARAADLLTEVVLRRWDQQRFAEIELLALMELNRVLVKAQRSGPAAETSKLDPRLVMPLDVDVRIVVTPCSDTFVHIEVVEPSGQRAYNGYGETVIGGLIGRFSAVQGPAEYLLHKAVHGPYLVRANAAESGRPLVSPLTLRVDMYTQYGRDNEQCRSQMVVLKNSKQPIFVGRMKF